MVNRITAAELQALQDADTDFLLIDTRSEEDYQAFHIHGAQNIPFSPDDGLSDEEIQTALEDVEPDQRIVLICAKGISAADFVDQLDELGYDNVQMVDKGMEGWSTVYDTVTLPVGDDLEVIQLQRRAKGCLGYVVGSKSDGTAVIVDPTRHTDVFLDAARQSNYEVNAVVDTHIHADHISGAPTLAAELDIPYYLGSPASEQDVEHEHKTIEPNEVIEIGSMTIKAIHTPGHTEGMMTLLLNDAAVLTADTLHIDSVGRVELAFEDEDVETGAQMLYKSLHRTLCAQPDESTIYPGHFTVTADGEYENATPGLPIESTIGRVQRDLDILNLDEDEFVSRLTEEVPEKPPNYETIVAINQGIEELEDEEEAEQLELGPNNCSA